MYLIAPHGRKKKWDIRLRNHDGKLVCIPGDRKEPTAKRLGGKIVMLVDAKVNGDPPPGELKTWINNMSPKLSKRLVSLGLIEQRRIEQSKSIWEQIDEFEKVVAARKSNTPEHAKSQANKVRKVFHELSAPIFTELSEDALSKLLMKWNREIATRRHYIIALKDFCAWMVRTKRATENLLIDMAAPGQYENPSVERQPLTVGEFQKLMKYLDTFERYPLQKSRWTAAIRKLIYWVAVKTGYRKSELASLKRWNLLLEETPPRIILKAGKAKNKTAGSVPIPDDLAAALRKYVKELDADDKLFPFPSSCRGVVDMLRRDLDGAGIPWKLPGGEIRDFHAFRHTAITWWLTIDRLTPKHVQVLARLKTFALIQNYTRNWKLEEFGWLNKGPKLASERRKAA